MSRELSIYKLNKDKAVFIKSVVVGYTTNEDKNKLMNIIGDINNNKKFVIAQEGLRDIITVSEFEQVCRDLGAL